MQIYEECSEPQSWPFRKGETGNVKGETKSANFWGGKVWTHRNCANFWQGKCKLIANFSGKIVTSLPSLSLCISLSHRAHLTHNMKRFRASYNNLSIERLIIYKQRQRKLVSQPKTCIFPSTLQIRRDFKHNNTVSPGWHSHSTRRGKNVLVLGYSSELKCKRKAAGSSKKLQLTKKRGVRAHNYN